MTKLRTSWKTVDDYIAEYAFAIYQRRCEHGIEGDHLSDWYAGTIAYEEACERGRLELITAIMEELRQEDERFILTMRMERGIDRV